MTQSLRELPPVLLSDLKDGRLRTPINRRAHFGCSKKNTSQFPYILYIHLAEDQISRPLVYLRRSCHIPIRFFDKVVEIQFPWGGNIFGWIRDTSFNWIGDLTPPNPCCAASGQSQKIR